LVHTCPHTSYDYAINVWLVRSDPWQEKIKSRHDLTSRNRRSNDLMHNAPSEIIYRLSLAQQQYSPREYNDSNEMRDRSVGVWDTER